MLDKAFTLVLLLKTRNFQNPATDRRTKGKRLCCISYSAGVFLKYFDPGFRVPQGRYDKEYVLRFFRMYINDSKIQ